MMKWKWVVLGLELWGRFRRRKGKRLKLVPLAFATALLMVLAGLDEAFQF